MCGCLKSLIWRMRAAVKKAVKNGCCGRQAAVKFQYDPWSYALNFDDGLGDDERANVVFHLRRDSCCEPTDGNCSKIATTLVCVLWMEA